MARNRRAGYFLSAKMGIAIYRVRDHQWGCWISMFSVRAEGCAAAEMSVVAKRGSCLTCFGRTVGESGGGKGENN